MSISKLASVHPDARVGKDVTIEPFATIYGDVVIGDSSWIGPNCVLMDGARIGSKCRGGVLTSTVVTPLARIGPSASSTDRWMHAPVEMPT